MPCRTRPWRPNEDVVIIFNPMLNPDNLDRATGPTVTGGAQPRRQRSRAPNTCPAAHQLSLTSTATGAHQHPGSQGRLAHSAAGSPTSSLISEQGNSNYFFMPGKPERTNPLTPAIQQLTAHVGDYHARTFDNEGTLYFSGEGYDDFFWARLDLPRPFGCMSPV